MSNDPWDYSGNRQPNNVSPEIEPLYRSVRPLSDWYHDYDAQVQWTRDGGCYIGGTFYRLVLPYRQHSVVAKAQRERAR